MDELMKNLFVAMHRRKKVIPKIQGLDQLSFGDMAVFGVMTKHLSENHDNEAVPMTGLLRELCTSPPALSQSINRLEDKGLVQRIFSKENRRVTYVAFTEKGKEIYQRQKKQRDDIAQKIIQRMGVENVRELVRLTNRFYDVAEELMEESKGEK